MMYSYMATFAKQPFPLEKVVNKWIKQSKELKRQGVSIDKQNARIGLLASMKREGNPKNIGILAREYVDDKGRTRKRAVAMIEERVRPRQRGIYIDTLISNPKGDLDKSFGNATDTLVTKLKQKYPDYGVQIKANRPEVSNIYTRKLGVPADIINGEYSHTALIRDIP